MNTKDFIRLGVPLGEATRRATDFITKYILADGDKTRLEQEVRAIIANPSEFMEDTPDATAILYPLSFQSVPLLLESFFHFS